MSTKFVFGLLVFTFTVVNCQERRQGYASLRAGPARVSPTQGVVTSGTPRLVPINAAAQNVIPRYKAPPPHSVASYPPPQVQAKAIKYAQPQPQRQVLRYSQPHQQPQRPLLKYNDPQPQKQLLRFAQPQAQQLYAPQISKNKVFKQSIPSVPEKEELDPAYPPDPNPQYSFSFDVKDDDLTNYQNRHEERDGGVIKGSYSVIDPDGYVRTVTYTADSENGFQAKVQREPTDVKVKFPVPTQAPDENVKYATAGPQPSGKLPYASQYPAQVPQFQGNVYSRPAGKVYSPVAAPSQYSQQATSVSALSNRYIHQ